jgi:peptide/nickel transport system permease protein
VTAPAPLPRTGGVPDTPAVDRPTPVPAPDGRGWSGWSRGRRLAALVLGVLAAFAVVGPLVWSDPVGQDLARFLERPSPAEPLGRDHLGRSVVARVAHATRLSLLLAAACVATAAVAGGVAGAVAAWRGRWVDATLHGLAQALVALPALLVVLLVSALANGGLWAIFGGLALAQWVEYFLVVRARAGLVLASPAVEAAGLLGLGPVHVVRRHLWPDLRPLLTTMAAFGVGTSILALSTLGFVGVGVRPPTPELGLLITEAFPYYDEAPWLSAAPVVVLAVLLVGLLGLRERGEVR